MSLRNWCLESHPQIALELFYRRKNLPPSFTSAHFIDANVAHLVAEADNESSNDVLCFKFDQSLRPEIYSWPVQDRPVTMIFGDNTAPLELRFVEVLRSYRPSSVSSFLFDIHSGWLGPFEHEVAA